MECFTWLLRREVSQVETAIESPFEYKRYILAYGFEEIAADTEWKKENVQGDLMDSEDEVSEPKAYPAAPTQAAETSGFPAGSEAASEESDDDLNPCLLYRQEECSPPRVREAAANSGLSVRIAKKCGRIPRTQQIQECDQEIQALCKLGKQKVFDGYAPQWERNDGGPPPKTSPCAQWYPEESFFLPWIGREVSATMGHEAEAKTFGY
mmetsp:Transcript_2382/g.2638  ORF Transcript_2382/g.2638 Transcript_2382/m.2638 type:complete len:209 (-) Transcript_2382:109-735(-)|eukprot:Skav213855  [mRNA]  locus=scaffold2366:186216:186842:- [translate_table: standard]